MYALHPRAMQPRKPFVQEISRKKYCKVFQYTPYIFPYILFPYVMHVLYLVYGGLQYLYMVPAQIYSMHVLLYRYRSESAQAACWIFSFLTF